MLVKVSPQIRRTVTVLVLELYAILLAYAHLLHGPTTDEAKYLLSIPYPHPPLARWIMSQTEFLPFQEFFWRIVFASLLVQGVWFVARLNRSLSNDKRFALCGLWLLSGSIIFQAGTIMMASLTAFQGLVFLWYLEREDSNTLQAGWIALFWFASLFTAYQAILYTPIVFLVFWRMRIAPSLRLLLFGVPILLTVLYIATNPLAMGSFLNASTENAGMSAEQVLSMIGGMWLIAGAGVLSVLGLTGMIRAKRFALIFSFILVCAFLLVSLRSYYPILFLPLLIGGVAHAPQLLQKSHFILAIQLVASVILLVQHPLNFSPSKARITMERVSSVEREGDILIAGKFGHNWQYETSSTIRRFRLALLSQAKAVVCLETCTEVGHYGWRQLEDSVTEVWVHGD